MQRKQNVLFFKKYPPPPQKKKKAMAPVSRIGPVNIQQWIEGCCII